MRLWYRSVVSTLVSLSVGCGGGNTASQVLKNPELPTDTQAKCRVSKSQAEPLIVEWPETARAKLESLRKRGLVVVRYEGCELEVISQCRAKGNYTYSGVTAKQTTRKIRDADELYANLPLGAVKFEGKLQSAGQLNVDMTLVGRYEAPAARFSRGDLEGDCETATHVIAALAVGSFTFSAGSDAAVGGSVGTVVPGVGGGGKSVASRELLTRDGDEKACAGAGSKDQAPPEGCGAMLQLEVVPVAAGRGSSLAAVDPRPSEVEPPRFDPRSAAHECRDQGRVWTGTRCVEASPQRCPSGKHREGNGCVPDVEPEPERQPEPERKPERNVLCNSAQVLRNGVCEAKTCPPSTHLEAGACMPDEQQTPKSAPQLMWYLSGGLLAGAGVAGVTALSRSSDAKKLCDDTRKTCPQEAYDKNSSALTLAWVSTGLLAAGIASFAITSFWPVLFGDSKKASLQLVPGPGNLLAAGTF
jgi:hypothetical protein